MQLSDRFFVWLISALFVFEGVNIGADVFVDSYESNGSINFAFNAIITALATDRFVSKRRKADDE